MPQSASRSRSPNPTAETPSQPNNSKSSPVSSMKSPATQNSIELYAVQCKECLKWRLIPTEEEYEEIRSKSIEEPFVCSKKANARCKDDPDIEYDSSRTWEVDRPNIPKTPTGFKRKLVMRRDFSKLDAYYLTPTGKKLRSGTEVSRYLEGHPEILNANVNDFSFAVPKIAEETIPADVDRKRTPKSDKKPKVTKMKNMNE